MFLIDFTQFSVTRTNVSHEEDQPSHLKIKSEWENKGPEESWTKFAGPEQRFCPAKVYEFVPKSQTDTDTNETNAEGKNGKGKEAMKLVINKSNCIHCKTCDIKTPNNYILWTVPEGGGGPN